MRDKIKVWDILIIGGGASGLSAAIEAARSGASVIVLEKNHVPGRKILSTGAGRCNFSNERITPEDYNESGRSLVKSAFQALPPHEILNFFESLGLLWIKGPEGRLFPRSMKAQDVVNVLVNEARRLGAEIRLLVKALRIVPLQRLPEFAAFKPCPQGNSLTDNAGIFAVEAEKVLPQWEKKKDSAALLNAASGRKAASGKEIFYARNVIVSAGSPCCARIGGSYSGYELLKPLGHTVTDIIPVITPLEVKEKCLKDADGVRTDAAIKFVQRGIERGIETRHPRILKESIITSSVGEIIFSKGFLSGPCVLYCARLVQEKLRLGPVYADLDFFPEYSATDLHSMLAARQARLHGSQFQAFIAGLHNEKLLLMLASLAGIKSCSPITDIRHDSMTAFEKSLKAFRIEITGPAGFEEAAAASGGICSGDIIPVSFESKICGGLFITGEVLDVDGRSGGFNLHFAWTSGILAARAAIARKHIRHSSRQ